MKLRLQRVGRPDPFMVIFLRKDAQSNLRIWTRRAIESTSRVQELLTDLGESTYLEDVRACKNLIKVFLLSKDTHCLTWGTPV